MGGQSTLDPFSRQYDNSLMPMVWHQWYLYNHYVVCLVIIYCNFGHTYLICCCLDIDKNQWIGWSGKTQLTLLTTPTMEI